MERDILKLGIQAPMKEDDKDYKMISFTNLS